MTASQRILQSISARLRNQNGKMSTDKVSAEIGFWQSELARYVRWYEGSDLLYNVAPPNDDQKVNGYSLRFNAAMTWLELFQKRKYLADLRLQPGSFAGRRLLDVGCGPFPNILAFHDCERHGLDPIVDHYHRAGFPITEWSRTGYAYHNAFAERMPFEDRSFDAIVSVNAIDHVDDFPATASEIRRILSPGGLFCMHVHYHPATVCEPIELDDEIFQKHFGWVPGLRKVAAGRSKDCGLYTAPRGELFVVWSNLNVHDG